MKRITLLILFFYALTSINVFAFCKNHHSEFVLYRNQDSSTTTRNTIPAYFPLTFFKERNSYVGSDTFLVTWYSRQLYALKEPVLFSLKSENEVYRFTWLRTFDNPIAIRMEKQDDTYKLYWKVCDGAGGYEPGNLIIDETTDVTEEVWNSFIKMIKRLDFWDMEPLDSTFDGLDGSQWILEGKNYYYYRVVDRWSPYGKNMYSRCCKFLLDLTNLDISEDKIY